MLRIAAVDDHALFRAGIRAILAPHSDIEFIAEGSNGEEALHIARTLEPHVLLLDVDMPGMSGLEVTRRIAESGLRVRVLVLSMHVEPPFPQHLLEAGALGYLGKGCSAEEMLTAIRRVASGRRYLQAEIAQEMAFDSRRDVSPFEQLSPRELDVCLALVRGERGRTLAEHVGLSEKTISTYKSRLMEKLTVGSVAELTQLAITYGLLPASSAAGAQLLAAAEQERPSG
jgi:DNA-binding NarL/FixJ family response regulator